jgi:hypothetical protein
MDWIHVAQDDEVTAFCEHSNEPSGFIEDDEYFLTR